MGKTSLWTSRFCTRNGKLDTKGRSRQTKSRKEDSRTALDGKFDTETQGSITCLKLSLATARMSRYGCSIISSLCFFSGMLHVYKSEVHGAFFER